MTGTVSPRNAVEVVSELIARLADDWESWSRDELVEQHRVKDALIRLYRQVEAIEATIVDRVKARGWPSGKPLREVATPTELAAFERNMDELFEVDRALDALDTWQRRIIPPHAGPEGEPLP